MGTRFLRGPGASTRESGFLHTGQGLLISLLEDSVLWPSGGFRASMIHLWQKRWPNVRLVSITISQTAQNDNQNIPHTVVVASTGGSMQIGHRKAVRSERPFSCSASCWALMASSRCFDSVLARAVEPSSPSRRSMSSVEESSSDWVCMLDVEVVSEWSRRGRFVARESWSEGGCDGLVLDDRRRECRDTWGEGRSILSGSVDGGVWRQGRGRVWGHKELKSY